MSSIDQIDDESIETLDDFEDHLNDQDTDVDSEKPEAEDYGKKVQKRIDKLVYERNSERDQRAKLEAELAAERQRRAELEQHVSKATDEQLQAQMAQKRAQKAELFEVGDFEGAAKIDDELLDLKLKQHQGRARNDDSQRQQEVIEQKPVERPKAEQDWLNENDWFYNPAKSDMKDKAIEIYNALKDEGYDPEDGDLYAELDKRLRGNDQQKDVRRERVPAGVGPDRGGAVGDSKSPKFTAEDSATMRRWGLDPNDVNARKEYLRNKMGA